jgi:hypothetical protein
MEQTKNGSQLVNASEATTWIDIAFLEGRRSIQLSYGRILGYSLDSTKDVTPIRQPIVANLGAIRNNWSNFYFYNVVVKPS